MEEHYVGRHHEFFAQKEQSDIDSKSTQLF